MPDKILVVDDEPDLELLLRQKLRRRLRSEELTLYFAGDGVEALQMLDADPDIDLVLSDINMPRMDGLTLLNEITRLERHIKVIIVSAYGDMSNIRTAMNRGAFDFITKPIDFEDLETTVDKTRQELQTLRQATLLQGKLSMLEHELEIASQIQLSSLPSSFPAFPGRDDVDLYATMIPAREVGGDFYDFFLLDDNRIGFVIGDVSGKGVGAALFMAVTRTLLRATALQGLAPAACVTHVNRVLYPESLPRMFVTLFYGVLDTDTGTVTYCNAGHNTPYLIRTTGEVTPLARTGGLGLCLTAHFDYQQQTCTLHPGDTLVCYTDGVTEAINHTREQFDEERLEACLAQATDLTPDTLIRAVQQALHAFTGGATQSDDITLLALQKP